MEVVDGRIEVSCVICIRINGIGIAWGAIGWHFGSCILALSAVIRHDWDSYVLLLIDTMMLGLCHLGRH
jgi:hypothetical protein